MPPKKPRSFKSRIVGHGEEAPDQLLANCKNWRIHPDRQQAALEGVLEEVGWVQSVMVNRKTGNIVDGHLRVMLAMRHGDKTIPVVYVELTRREEDIILATFDPVSALAGLDNEKLAELVAGIDTDNEKVRDLLDGLLDGFELPESSEGDGADGGGEGRGVECPNCGHEFVVE